MDFFHRLRRGDQLQALVYCLGPVTETKRKSHGRYLLSVQFPRPAPDCSLVCDAFVV